MDTFTMRAPLTRLSTLLLLGGALLLNGCATNGDRRDPLEPLNRGIYQFNDAVDKAVLKPVAQGYRAVLPGPVRTGAGNFFSNLNDVVVTANDLFQFKIDQAAADFSRILFNSTFGVLGLFDVATPWGLPKHNEDFGQTLGRWGIGNGPYLVLPFAGPSTVRDTAGLAVDKKITPVWRVRNIPRRNRTVFIEVVDKRARLLDAEKVLDEAALDKYTFVRDAYLQKRRSLVYDGNPPREDQDNNEIDDMQRELAPAP